MTNEYKKNGNNLEVKKKIDETQLWSRKDLERLKEQYETSIQAGTIGLAEVEILLAECDKHGVQ